jgi:hypothetical protein
MLSTTPPVEVLLAQVNAAVAEYASTVATQINEADAVATQSSNTEERLQYARLTAMTILYYRMQADLGRAGLSVPGFVTAEARAAKSPPVPSVRLGKPAG